MIKDDSDCFVAPYWKHQRFVFSNLFCYFYTLRILPLTHNGFDFIFWFYVMSYQFMKFVKFVKFIEFVRNGVARANVVQTDKFILLSVTAPSRTLFLSNP